jgi:hypothetical protein
MRAFLFVGFGCFCTVASAADLGPPQNLPTQQYTQAGPQYVAVPCLPTPCVAVPCPPTPCFSIPYPPTPCFASPCFATPCYVLPSCGVPYFAIPSAAPQKMDTGSQQEIKPEPSPADKPKCDEPTSPAASQPASMLTPDQTRFKVISVVGCIGVDINAQTPPKGFKCELMKVKASKTADVFGNVDWYPDGKAAELTADQWKVVSTAILSAVNDPPPNPTTWHSPFVAVRAEIPAGDASCVPGQYVILMSFDGKWLQLYFKGSLIGKCAINDNDRWSDILTNAGISLTPQSSSTKQE